MKHRARILALFTAILSTPGAAFAGSAGGNTIPCEATQQLRFVVDDDGDGVRDPGENTACANPTVDLSDPNLPLVRDGAAGPVCLPAVVAQLRATLTLIADDDAKDNDIGGSQNTGDVALMLLEIRSGDQVFRLADAYTAPLLGSLNLGNWDNRLQNENDIFTVEYQGGLFLTPAAATVGAFDAMGDRVAQIAQNLGLVANAADVLPIVANPVQDGERKRFVQSSPTLCDDGTGGVGCGEAEVDEQASSLASIAVYRLTISLAEKLVGPPPSCT